MQDVDELLAEFARPLACKKGQHDDASRPAQHEAPRAGRLLPDQVRPKLRPTKLRPTKLQALACGWTAVTVVLLTCSQAPTHQLDPVVLSKSILQQYYVHRL